MFPIFKGELFLGANGLTWFDGRLFSGLMFGVFTWLKLFGWDTDGGDKDWVVGIFGLF